MWLAVKIDKNYISKRSTEQVVYESTLKNVIIEIKPNRQLSIGFVGLRKLALQPKPASYYKIINERNRPKRILVNRFIMIWFKYKV